MEPGAGERWAERLRTLQLPRIHAYGNETTWKLLAPRLERKDGGKNRLDGKSSVYSMIMYDMITV